MKKIAIVVLSVVLGAAIISGLILYGEYLDTKDALLISEKKIFELNEKVIQLNQGTSAFHDQIRRNAERFKELENALNMKDQTLSELKEKLQQLERKFEEEKKSKGALKTQLSSKDAMVIGLQKTLKSSQSYIPYLEKEIAKGKRDLEELYRRISELQGEKDRLKSKIGQLQSTYTAFVSELKNQIQNKEVTIKALEDKLSITFVDRILFESGKATITPEGKKILTKVGEILKNVQGRQIRVIGHTDNISIMPEYRYKFPSNWELSAARAAAVVRHFQKKVGLDPRNLEAAGHSFYKPIASNETEEGRAQNRRVNIIVAPKTE